MRADAWPAYRGALDWRAEATEGHAVIAAQAIARGDVHAAETEEVAEPRSAQSGYRESLEEWAPMLDAAERFDEDVSCWTEAATSDEPLVVRKALHTLARLGAPWAEVGHAVLPLISLDDGFVWAGRSAWTQIQQLAQSVRARQRARMQ